MQKPFGRNVHTFKVTEHFFIKFAIYRLVVI
jgi:hypothetical protein